MENALGCMTKEKFQANYKIPAERLEKFVKIEPVVCTRSSSFLGGLFPSSFIDIPNEINKLIDHSERFVFLTKRKDFRSLCKIFS